MDSMRPNSTNIWIHNHGKFAVLHQIQKQRIPVVIETDEVYCHQGDIILKKGYAFELVRTSHRARCKWSVIEPLPQTLVARQSPYWIPRHSRFTFSKRCMSWLGGVRVHLQQITTSQDIMNCCGAPPMNAWGKQDRHTWRQEKKNLQLTLCNHSVSTISTECGLDFGHFFGSFLLKQQQSGDSEGACSLGGKACRTASWAAIVATNMTNCMSEEASIQLQLSQLRVKDWWF